MHFLAIQYYDKWPNIFYQSSPRVTMYITINQQSTAVARGKMHDYQSTLSKADTLGTKATVCFKVVLHWSTCNANLQWYDVSQKIVLV